MFIGVLKVYLYQYGMVPWQLLVVFFFNWDKALLTREAEANATHPGPLAVPINSVMWMDIKPPVADNSARMAPNSYRQQNKKGWWALGRN